MVEPDTDLLTVAEASVRFGLSERRLRRLMALPQNAARTVTQTVTVTRSTVTGNRSATALPASLWRSLVEGTSQAQAEEGTRRERGQERGGNVDETRRVTVPSEGDTTSWRERALVAEARVELLAAEREGLSEALKREQENVRGLVEQLATATSQQAVVLAATGRLQIPTQTTPEGPTRDDGATDGRSPGDGGDDVKTDDAATSTSRPWWKWWR